MSRQRLRWIRFFLALLSVCACNGAFAAATGNWTGNGSSSASTTVLGIELVHTGSTGSGNYSNVTFAVNSTWWTNPYGGTVSGGQGLGIPMTIASGTRSVVVTFSEPVDNPILHVSRIGGTTGTSYHSSVWDLSSSVSQGGAVTMQRLSGNAQFVLNAAGVNGFRRTTGGNGGLTSPSCGTADTTTGCGSIQFNGTGITSLTFSVSMRGGGSADQLDFIWSFAGSQVLVSKRTVDGTGVFSFSGSNGVGAFNLDTATANPASSAAFAVNDHASAISITEAAAPGYTLTSAACVDQNNTAVASTLNGRELSVPAASYGGNQTITCAFVNTRIRAAALSITKSDGAGVTTYTPGGTASYLIQACNAAGAGAADGATVLDDLPAGVVLTAPWTCAGTGGAVCSAASGGAVGGTSVSLTATVLPAAGCLSITVPVAFSSDPDSY